MKSPEQTGESPVTQPITRRCFVKIGGALFVSLAVAPQFSLAAGSSADSPDPAILASWLEIHHDNTIVMRTGRTETGTGMTAYYAQAIAEELRVRPETVSLVLGDTDRTPDGGFSAGFLNGMYNVRKVAAYTREAILKLSATRLGVPRSRLTISDGMVSGGGKKISYGRLVEGQHLELTIPVSGKLPRIDADEWNGLADLEGFKVTGNPPLTPASKCKVIGTSYPVPGIPDKITGKTKWSCDVRLPGMLHARMVRPATLGSTLISVGELDKEKFPTAEIVRKANLVAVVSPDEWEATRAAVDVAAGTKWTDWSGLPGSENVTKTLRARDWGKASETRQDGPSAAATLASAARKISASYELPYVRHAPIGPFVAVADARRNGRVTVWTHSAQSQGLRVQIAHTLGIPKDRVVIRWLDHSGQYGRTTFGGDGAEADAAILSHLLGKPVRVQWSLEHDLAWSSVSPAWVIDAEAGLDATGRLSTFHWSSYSPHESDARLLGAVLAGLPCTNSLPGGWVATEWVYNKIDSRLEEAYGMPNLAGDSAFGGLRGNIMRTPGQRQQNFAIECLMNEAAAAVPMDPIQFRLNHTSDERLKDILNATAQAAAWEPRPSPHPHSRKTGTEPVTGRGVCIMRRENAYWAGIAEISLVPDTGEIQVSKFTVGCEPGKIMNPRQLGLCMKSGVVMGLSEGLKEEVTFDKQKVTSTDWNRYKILTMAETPEIHAVQLSRDTHGFGGGSEGANAVVPAALAAAVFDATGVQPRRLPLTPEYIGALLKA